MSTAARGSTKWQPEGFHTVTPQIAVSDATKAIEWYKKALGAEDQMVMKIPDTGKVMHGEVKIGDSIFFISDPHDEAGTVNKSSFFIYVPDTDASYKRAIDAGATSRMKPEDQFWGDRMASVNDPFGQSWSFATHIRDVSHEEMAKAQQEYFKKFSGK